MFAIQSLSIPSSTVRDLLNFAADSGSLDAVAEFADQAIREWLACAKAPQSPQSGPKHGFQWKTLFLPEGTQLRVWSRENGSRYAEVVGDQIMHAGLPVTPNEFVRLQEGIPRNAWTEVSILMPGETAWKAAHIRRDELQRAARALRSPPPIARAAPLAAVVHSAEVPITPASLATPATGTAPHAAPGAASLKAAASRFGACLPGGPPKPEQPQRLPRVPPDGSQARIQAAQGPSTHWWPGGPERRICARRLEDSFLD
jgi:hypothetical protein